MKRLELKHVRRCDRCGRARAELETPEGRRLSIAMDAVRARELAGEDADLRWLADALLEGLRASGVEPGEVVVDAGPAGLRGLLSVLDGDESDLIACTAQEAVSLAVRGGLRLYATPEALASAGGAAGPADPDPDTTVH